MSDELRRTLDAQRRRLDEIDALADALLAGDDVVVPEVRAAAAGDQEFEDVVAINDILRAERGWEDLLPPPRDGRSRRDWSQSDLAVVGLAGTVGVVAAWYEGWIDGGVRDLLEPLSETRFFKRLEKDARSGVIDYQKAGFGGPHHRARNPGHDLLRFVETVYRVQKGEFRGIKLGVGPDPIFVDPEAADPVASLVEATVQLFKHLVTDFVTPTSLPLPGTSLLDELLGSCGQDFNRLLYQGEREKITGMTLRGGTLHLLPLLSTELIVRVHLHLRAYQERQTFALTEDDQALRSEMLLVGHGLTGAASLGRTLTTAMFGDLRHRVLSVRHLNVPVLLRIAALGVSVARARRDRLSKWEDHAHHLEAPWDLELSLDIEAAVAAAS